MDVASPFSLVDSHAHIQGAEFAADFDSVMERARAAGVEQIVAVGGAGEMASNRAAIALAESFPNIHATVGMHPHDAKDVGAAELQQLADLCTRAQVVAVGETGLDFYYDHSPRDVQRRVFASFIRLARQTGLPIVVHERDASHEAVELLRSEGEGVLRGVIHCFTGDYEAARSYLDLGFYLSFSGIITFKNAAGLRDVVRKVPLDRVLVETDAPFLAPVPHRGKRNEPAWVRDVAATVAAVRNISLDAVMMSTSANARQLFGI